MEEYGMEFTTVRKVPRFSETPIDIYEDDFKEGDVERIYEVWGEGVSRHGWPLPEDLGSVKVITMEMLKEIPEEELESIYYKRRTRRIQEVLEEYGFIR